jgi:hypothetical protein
VLSAAFLSVHPQLYYVAVENLEEKEREVCSLSEREGTLCVTDDISGSDVDAYRNQEFMNQENIFFFQRLSFCQHV